MVSRNSSLGKDKSFMWLYFADLKFSCMTGFVHFYNEHERLSGKDSAKFELNLRLTGLVFRYRLRKTKLIINRWTDGLVTRLVLPSLYFFLERLGQSNSKNRKKKQKSSFCNFVRLTGKPASEICWLRIVISTPIDSVKIDFAQQGHSWTLILTKSIQVSNA